MDITKTQGIIVCGMNGSGKTTLGRELARILNFKHLDIEDYHFHDAEIPYSNPRSTEETLALMLVDIKKYPSFVVTTVNGDYLGKEILSHCHFVVYLDAPLEVRLKRVKQRSYDKFGDRVLVGGDMYTQESEFYEFVTNRSSEKLDKWIGKVEYPVVLVNGMNDYKTNAEFIASEYNEFLKM